MNDASEHTASQGVPRVDVAGPGVFTHYLAPGSTEPFRGCQVAEGHALTTNPGEVLCPGCLEAMDESGITEDRPAPAMDSRRAQVFRQALREIQSLEVTDAMVVSLMLADNPPAV